MIRGKCLVDSRTDNADSFMHEEESERETPAFKAYICDGMFEGELINFQFGMKNLKETKTEHLRTNTW